MPLRKYQIMKLSGKYKTMNEQRILVQRRCPRNPLSMHHSLWPFTEQLHST